MKNKKVLIWTICGVVAVALIALVVVLVLGNNNDNNGPKKHNKPEQKEKKNETNEVVDVHKGDLISEEEIIAIYGMSKKDAEEIVKAYFTEDGYEFSTNITGAGFYRVTVNDTVSKDTLSFRVDPATKTAIQE